MPTALEHLESSRVRVAVVYGGRSGEHEVSVASARSVMKHIDRRRYEVIPVGISRTGAWLSVDPVALLGDRVEAGDPVMPSADPAHRGLLRLGDGQRAVASLRSIDVVFPLTHGTFGEDGCLQGLCELAGLPYVGSGVLGSAVGMDKILMKTAFKAAGLPIVEYVGVTRADWESDPGAVSRSVEVKVGFPCFVKPANLGSSVGISKVRTSGDLPQAMAEAAGFGARLIVERAVDARELECGVLGNGRPAASVVGEVIPHREFYDYEAKYRDASTEFVIPADVPPAIADEVRSLALRAFEATTAAGMARVDFFAGRHDGVLYVNEINTIPGFTSMSVYPRLWEASGLSYSELIDRLIELAIERHADQDRNLISYV